jgi:hypothetical protein
MENKEEFFNIRTLLNSTLPLFECRFSDSGKAAIERKIKFLCGI